MTFNSSNTHRMPYSAKYSIRFAEHRLVKVRTTYVSQPTATCGALFAFAPKAEITAVNNPYGKRKIYLRLRCGNAAAAARTATHQAISSRDNRLPKGMGGGWFISVFRVQYSVFSIQRLKQL